MKMRAIGAPKPRTPEQQQAYLQKEVPATLEF